MPSGEGLTPMWNVEPTRAHRWARACTLTLSLEIACQWIESVTDWAIRITDWGLFPDWVSSHARLADPIRPMPNKGKSGHSGLPIALISRQPDWVVQSVLPIAIHRLLHRFYPLARKGKQGKGKQAKETPASARVSAPSSEARRRAALLAAARKRPAV